MHRRPPHFRIERRLSRKPGVLFKRDNECVPWRIFGGRSNAPRAAARARTVACARGFGMKCVNSAQFIPQPPPPAAQAPTPLIVNSRQPTDYQSGLRDSHSAKQKRSAQLRNDRAAALTPGCCSLAKRRSRPRVPPRSCSDPRRFLQRRADAAVWRARRHRWLSSNSAVLGEAAEF
jgi:hypothetical protein